MPPSRRYPIGAELLSSGRTHFRVWAPDAKRLEVAIQADGNRDSVPAVVELAAEGNGYFSGEAEAAARCTASALMAACNSSPIRHRAHSRSTRTTPPPSWTRRLFAGPTASGKADRCAGR